MTEVTIHVSGLTRSDLVAVARHGAKVLIGKDALEAMAKTRAHVEALAKGDTPVYGI
ncbi:MAG: histidine ammonia-lyase, partial [Actinomycetota bacterium]